MFYFLPFIATCCCSVAQCMVEHLCGSHLLGGQFWSAPVENPREMSSDCQNLGEAAALALLHQVFTKNKWRTPSEAPSRQGSNQGLSSVSSFYKATAGIS